MGGERRGQGQKKKEKKNRMEGRRSRERALGAKIFTVRMDPTPSLLSSSVNDFECFGRKQKLIAIFDFQFSIFRLPPKTEKLSHATDCNIVGKAKLPLTFIFLFIVDRIKVKT